MERLHNRVGGRAQAMQDTHLEADPWRRYVTRVGGDARWGRVGTILVRQQHGNARVAIRWTDDGALLLLRRLLPLMRRSLAPRSQADRTKLTRLVEGRSDREVPRFTP